MVKVAFNERAILLKSAGVFWIIVPCENWKLSLIPGKQSGRSALVYFETMHGPAKWKAPRL